MTGCKTCADFANACDRYDFEVSRIRSTWGWLEPRWQVEGRFQGARNKWQAHLPCPSAAPASNE